MTNVSLYASPKNLGNMKFPSRLIFLCLPLLACTSARDSVVTFCNARDSMPSSYEEMFLGLAIWVDESVDDSTVRQRGLAILGTDDPDAPIRALRQLMDEHDVRECRELDVRYSTLDRDREGFRQMGGT